MKIYLVITDDKAIQQPRVRIVGAQRKCRQTVQQLVQSQNQMAGQ